MTPEFSQPSSSELSLKATNSIKDIKKNLSITLCISQSTINFSTGIYSPALEQCNLERRTSSGLKIAPKTGKSGKRRFKLKKKNSKRNKWGMEGTADRMLDGTCNERFAHEFHWWYRSWKFNCEPYGWKKSWRLRFKPLFDLWVWDEDFAGSAGTVVAVVKGGLRIR